MYISLYNLQIADIYIQIKLYLLVFFLQKILCVNTLVKYFEHLK